MMGLLLCPQKQGNNPKEKEENKMTFLFCTALFVADVALGTWIMTGYKG